MRRRVFSICIDRSFVPYVHLRLRQRGLFILYNLNLRKVSQPCSARSVPDAGRGMNWGCIPELHAPCIMLHLAASVYIYLGIVP